MLATTSETVKFTPPTKHHPENAEQALGVDPFDPKADAPSAVALLTGFAGKVDLWDLQTRTFIPLPCDRCMTGWRSMRRAAA